MFGHVEKQILSERATAATVRQSPASVAGGRNGPPAPGGQQLSPPVSQGSLQSHPIQPDTLESDGAWSRPSQLNGIDLGLSARRGPVSSADPQDSDLGSLTPRPIRSPAASPGLSPQPQRDPQSVLSLMALESTAPSASHLSASEREVSAAASGKSEGDHGPLLNEVVCGALMLAYERAGMWAEAIAVIGRCRALGIRPNTVMFNTGISAAGKAGQMDIAERLFAAVPRPDAITHETMVASHGLCGRPQQAEAALKRMIQAGFRPRCYAYCGLVAAYSLSRDLASALVSYHNEAFEVTLNRSRLTDYGQTWESQGSRS